MRVKAAGTGIPYFGWRFRKLAGSAWLGLSGWSRKQAHYADVIVPLSPARRVPAVREAVNDTIAVSHLEENCQQNT